MTERTAGPVPPKNGNNTVLDAELRKIRFQMRMDLLKARSQARIDEEAADALASADELKAIQANYYALQQAVYDAHLDVAKAGGDRAQARATFVATAAGVIGSAYAALLGLLYKTSIETVSLPLPSAATISITPTSGVPSVQPVSLTPPAEVQTAVARLPDYVTQISGSGDKGPVLTVLLNHRPELAAILPEVFIAGAVLLATTYLSYLVRGRPLRRRSSVGLPAIQNRNELYDFIDWVAGPIYARAWLLHAAVTSLGLGVLTLPVPFLGWPRAAVTAVLVMGIIVVVVGGLIGPRSKAEHPESAKVPHGELPPVQPSYPRTPDAIPAAMMPRRLGKAILLLALGITLFILSFLVYHLYRP